MSVSGDIISIALVEDEKNYSNNLAEYLTLKGCTITSNHDGVDLMLAEALEKAIFPKIILLDNNLGGEMTGIDQIVKIKQNLPDADVIILTSHDDSSLIFSALCNGAIGYLTKGMTFENIYDAILDVANGGSCMTPSIARKVFNFFNVNRTVRNPKFDQLTAREYEIAEGIRDGLSYKLIADKLDISIETVRYHVKNTYRKLHVNSKSEVVSAFYENKIPTDKSSDL
jgi:DNA-binding NarL/FixJ family response regulator